ncbi:hypothetical protein NC653_008197 [Populus alba x Populus x berolinensis]|uniref:Protein root UVB sensitive/RUS domain-containing protein n=1 Tax=Populus alba x Populus x berolinensis TaxID=444605 RepID=A0AAD6R642_9ROSI|nr:hypothetical protein NC653_008197 [Populus alba x Populus x berolinensis]
MGTWLPAISITKAPLDVIQIGSHLIRHATSAQATELGLFLISLRMSLSCLQHHRLRHCFLLRSYGPNAQLCLYVSCFLKGFLKVLPLITWIILFANRPRHCKPSIALRRWFEERSDSTAAAIKWVLKDGIGYISVKSFCPNMDDILMFILKSWRLGRDIRPTLQITLAATRSCFYAGFAAKRNFAEVIAKGEAQGMVSKYICIMLGITLACTGSSTSLALASFSLVTWIHMFYNLYHINPFNQGL